MLMDELFAKSRAGKVELEPFFYSANFAVASFTAGATVTTPISINADSKFVIKSSQLTAYTAAPAWVVNPNYRLTIFDTGSGRTFMNQAIHIGSIMGNGQRPYFWPEPKLIAPASVLDLTLINNDAAAAEVQIVLSGMKVYEVASYGR